MLRFSLPGYFGVFLMLSFPEPVTALISAINFGDLELMLAAFVDDALVNDQLINYWGKQQIFGWASRDIIQEHLTMQVVSGIAHYQQFISTVHIDGDFDKRGLPDPLVLTLYFSFCLDKITQLIILRNHSGF